MREAVCWSRRVWHARHLLLALGLAALLLPGCGKKKSEKSSGYVESLVGAKQLAERTACQARLHDLGRTLTIHAAANDGRFPPSLEDLARSGMASRELFRCPGRSAQPYQYIPGQQRTMPGENILVFEAEGVHQGQCNVLRLNGSVESVTPERLAAARAKTEAAIGAAGGR